MDETPQQTLPPHQPQRPVHSTTTDQHRWRKDITDKERRDAIVRLMALPIRPSEWWDYPKPEE